MIINAGDDLEKSILEMTNQVVTNNIQPEEWKEMIIKSICKGKGDKRTMNSKRGLFLTNIISKVVEKLIRNRTKSKIQNNMTPFQCGGVQNRGICDNLFIVNTTIEEFKWRKENLYILFADLEKCFDKLWLKDCIFEIVEAGMPEEEAMYVYNMNKNIKIKVDTPVGKTNEFQLKEVVRQGTIMGPPLCGVSTDKINKIGKESMLKVHNIEIKSPVFVDDMLGMGNNEMVEEFSRKVNLLEKLKKFTFNNDEGKTEILKMIFNKKSDREETNPEITVRKGKISYTEAYQYLGDQYDTSGMNMSKIRKKTEKINYMAYEIKNSGKYEEVGNADTEVRFLLLEQVAKPSLLYNTETWINITKEEEKELNRAQYQLLKKVFEQKENTPYYGIISETGIWPFSYVILYKKLMFFHHIMNSEEKRVVRQILMNQMKEDENNENDKKTWYREIKAWLNKMEMTDQGKEIMEIKKSVWKTMVKEKIEEIIRQEIRNAAKEMTKLRFIRGKEFEKQEYLEKCSTMTAKQIMKVRLNMVDIKMNYKSKYKDDLLCMACGKEEESSEHVIQCKEYKSLIGHNLGMDDREQNFSNTDWLLKASEVYARIEETREMMG